MTQEELDNKLLNAAYHGNLDEVKEYLDKGADIHMHYDYPLRWSAQNGYLNVVRHLVEQGADIHAEDDEALILAQTNNHHDVVIFLRTIYKNFHITKEIPV